MQWVFVQFNNNGKCRNRKLLLLVSIVQLYLINLLFSFSSLNVLYLQIYLVTRIHPFIALTNHFYFCCPFPGDAFPKNSSSTPQQMQNIFLSIFHLCVCVFCMFSFICVLFHYILFIFLLCAQPNFYFAFVGVWQGTNRMCTFNTKESLFFFFFLQK